MENPLVSVIITTFNRSQLLREAIESVLGQDFSDFELIIIDDASPGEETAIVVSSFSDLHIRYVKNQKNKGSTASLNIGLHTAIGKYVAILDDDDIWIDHAKLGKQVEFLDNHPDYVLVGTNAVIVDGETQKELTRTQWPKEDAEIRKIIFRKNPFAHSSVMYLKDSVLLVGGYDARLPRGKDYDLMLALGTHGKMAVLPDYALMYREAMPKNADLIARRLKDAKATAKVVLKHRDEYPSFLGAYVKILVRIFAFRMLSAMPALYRYRWIFHGHHS